MFAAPSIFCLFRYTVKVCFLSLVFVCIKIQLIMDTSVSLERMPVKMKRKGNYVGSLLVCTRLKLAVSSLRGLKVTDDGLSLHL